MTKAASFSILKIVHTMDSRELLSTGIALMDRCPQLQTRTNALNLWMAAVLTRQNEGDQPQEKAKRTRLFRWPDGRHWYATADGLDVVDEHGFCKWNTEQEAEDAAMRFLANGSRYPLVS